MDSASLATLQSRTVLRSNPVPGLGLLRALALSSICSTPSVALGWLCSLPRGWDTSEDSSEQEGKGPRGVSVGRGGGQGLRGVQVELSVLLSHRPGHRMGRWLTCQVTRADHVCVEPEGPSGQEGSGMGLWGAFPGAVSPRPGHMGMLESVAGIPRPGWDQDLVMVGLKAAAVLPMPTS